MRVLEITQRLAFIVALGASAVACASTGSRGTADVPSRRPDRGTVAMPTPDLSSPGLEERALLLLLVDRQLYEPFTLGRVLDHPSPDLRSLLAVTLARVPEERAVTMLEELTFDADRAVRRDAAFALSRASIAQAATLLEPLLLDADDEVAAWACHGLARGGVPLERVIAKVSTLPRESRQARLLPDLHLFAAGEPGRGVFEAVAVEGTSAIDPWLRRRAVLALSARAGPSQRPLFLRLLADRDAGVRALAAGGLGKVGAAEDLDVLRDASADPDLGVVVAAIEAAAAIVRAGRAAPPAEWRATLVERMTDTRPAVRATAIAAAAAWLLDPELETALETVASSGKTGEQTRAILALASARAPRAGAVVAEAAADAEPLVRVAAASAAGALDSTATLDRLAFDDSALVREAAFVARARLEARPRPDLYTRWLADPAPRVRASVLERLAGAPVVPFEPILNGFAKDERESAELALAGVDALRARAAVTPTERGAIVAALEGLAEVGTYPVRIAAADALEKLGRPRPATGVATTARKPSDYRSLVAQSREPRWVRIETATGNAIARIDTPEAPLESIAFLKLAEQGFYDGTTIGRVEPGRRLEAGDPRDDRRLGPGFTLRDEPGPRRVRPGAIGLVRPAPHAAGSRFFVQLGPGADSEGEATLLGEVVRGLDHLATLLEGDRIVRLREIPAPSELHSAPAAVRDTGR